MMDNSVIESVSEAVTKYIEEVTVIDLATLYNIEQLAKKIVEGIHSTKKYEDVEIDAYATTDGTNITLDVDLGPAGCIYTFQLTFDAKGKIEGLIEDPTEELPDWKSLYKGAVRVIHAIANEDMVVLAMVNEDYQMSVDTIIQERNMLRDRIDELEAKLRD